MLAQLSDALQRDVDWEREELLPAVAVAMGPD